MESDKAVPANFNPQELNQALVCILCFGYYRNAHTVKECLHSFCKSCIYKHFMENMDCPHCGKDLQPFPFDMILPDPLLQTLVDKLFPEAVEADYQEEMQFYIKRRLPLPERLASRGNRLNRSFEDLDASITAMSEADSEMMSESRSLDVSLMAPELVTNSNFHPTNETPGEHVAANALHSAEAHASAMELLDKQIDELVSVPAAVPQAPKIEEVISPPAEPVETREPQEIPSDSKVELKPEPTVEEPEMPKVTEKEQEPISKEQVLVEPSINVQEPVVEPQVESVPLEATSIVELEHTAPVAQAATIESSMDISPPDVPVVTSEPAIEEPRSSTPVPSESEPTAEQVPVVPQTESTMDVTPAESFMDVTPAEAPLSDSKMDITEPSTS